MKLFGKRSTETVTSIALVFLCVGLALALTVATNTGGWHAIFLTTTGSSNDTGLGHAQFNSSAVSDTAVRFGFFVRNTRSNGLNDTILADLAATGSGSGLALTGGFTSGTAATFTIQRSDSASINVSATFSDSATSSGTWSSELTGGTGTETSTFRASNLYSLVGARFGQRTGADTVADQFPLFNLPVTGDTTTTFSTAQDTIVVFSVDTSTQGDSVRLLVIDPANRLTYDTQMIRVTGAGAAGDTTFISQGNIRFEVGTTKLIAILWDQDTAKYLFTAVNVTISQDRDTLSGGAGTASANFNTATSNVANVTVTVPAPTTPVINAIDIIDNGGDQGFKSDSYANIDSNTSGMETRAANSVFTVNLLANDSSLITVLTGGAVSMTITMDSVVNDSSSLSLLRHNSITNSWEVAGTSQSFNSATGQLTVNGMTKFSNFALGKFSSSSSAPGGDGGTCVIENTFSGTSLSGIMPSLRGMRDSVLGSAAGRLFVSGYYGFAGTIAFLAFAGIGLTAVFKKN